MVFQVQGSGTMKRFLLLLLWSILLPELSSAQDMFKLPPLPLPEDYGSVLMDKEASKKNVGPVVFSHLIHRVKYTCRVCHYELEFSMKANDTSIQCDNGKMHGRYCATCHNGKISFAPEDKDEKNCSSCHGESSSASWKTSRELQEKLPKTGFGDGIDWSKALDEGYIKPKDSLSDSTREMVNIKTITLKAEMSGISSAVFPHKTHEQWLDCSSCHPELFNIKKKTTKSLRMANMVRGESCGICHLYVAFPLDDCRRCHPDMKR